ncbi:Oidioi.mRNA.OKI2018_I69.chr1.g1129.t1.cds [Oikopleura dioica]|uniref:Oidioi.mRNA.OKI2018_I69.chr1.g1129.t1.cds n=1 Tax=Oikopleura dioica TaxID=34765 RepID=A0ABN7SQR6_OIKDI|nr:Oidioi.mRNA.OKI2018_I69.chr1.g1129.t1.cds [Oikopleura dioica]
MSSIMEQLRREQESPEKENSLPSPSDNRPEPSDFRVPEPPQRKRKRSSSPSPTRISKKALLDFLFGAEDQPSTSRAIETTPEDNNDKSQPKSPKKRKHIPPRPASSSDDEDDGDDEDDCTPEPSVKKAKAAPYTPTFIKIQTAFPILEKEEESLSAPFLALIDGHKLSNPPKGTYWINLLIERSVRKDTSPRFDFEKLLKRGSRIQCVINLHSFNPKKRDDVEFKKYLPTVLDQGGKVVVFLRARVEPKKARISTGL